jgi:hypothetical protein
VGPRASLDDTEKKKSNSDRFVVQSEASGYNDFAGSKRVRSPWPVLRNPTNTVACRAVTMQ